MRMTRLTAAALYVSGALALAVQPTSAARAEIVLSELIVELQPGKRTRADVEVWNNSPDRAYVVAEPAEVLAAGTSAESRRSDPDPEQLGLLVSPARMILEPGQRRLVRIAAIGPHAGRERVYRVTIRPVAGQLSAEESGLKLLVGYDMLVLVRPDKQEPRISGSRIGEGIVFRNTGNVSVELIEGRQCRAPDERCTPLPAKRLYAGAEWHVQTDGAPIVEFMLKSPSGVVRRRF